MSVDDHDNIFTCTLQSDGRRLLGGLLGQHYRHGDIGEVANGAHHIRVLDALEGSSDNITVMVILVK